MAKATKKCKVCGAEYEYCHTTRRVSGVFRWQDVACCPEHGSIYLEKIIASRSEDSHIVESHSADSDENDEFDELFEEDFDDNPEEILIDTK